MDKNRINAIDNEKIDLDAISRQIFPDHDERSGYNQLAKKAGCSKPLSKIGYEYLKKNKRRPPKDLRNHFESKSHNRTLIRLTESDLHDIIKESVNRILKEGYYEDLYDYMGQSDEPDYCPYCDSHNIENVGDLPNWAGGTGDKWRCNDCGEEFDWDTYISHLPGYQEF